MEDALRLGDWMQTYMGRQFWPMDPRPAEIDIYDIAHALSMLCRYGGHSRKFYSVSEHCVHISDNVSPLNALWGLLHDASEAYLCDIVRPVKRHLSGYHEAELRLQRVICDKYGLPHRMPEEVKEADNRILLDERAAIMAIPPGPWVVDDLAPLGVEIECWTPARAKHRFLKRFRELHVTE